MSKKDKPTEYKPPTAAEKKRGAYTPRVKTSTRIPAVATTAGPKHLSTNIHVPSIEAGNSSLHFLPDRVLVRDGEHYSDVSYQQLRIHHSEHTFNETESPPGDAEVVNYRWLVVNKSDGGPDRRFRDNRQIPVMRYGLLEISYPRIYFTHHRLGQRLGWRWRLERLATR